MIQVPEAIFWKGAISCMEELTKLVKSEMLRTLLWLVVSLGIAIGIYYVVWK
jgi:hypothetical protein